MSDPALDGLRYRVRPPSGDPQGAIVLLHGRGTDENDLAPLLDVLDPRQRLVGLTPRAPLQLPPGGNHWYVVERVGYPQRATFDASRELLGAWLDALPDALGIRQERIVLGGFSQGTVMSYALGLGTGRPSPAGILALSGFIPTVDGFDLDLDGRQGLPVEIAHGAQDPVISIDFGRAAQRRLRDAGLAVTYRETPGGHHIDPRLLAELGDFVERVTGG